MPPTNKNKPRSSPEPAPWRVTYIGGFWDSHGRAGKEIPLNVPFRWGGESWIVPAAYACAEGLVLDLCMEAEPGAMKAFIEKWGLYREGERRYTNGEMREMDRENPLHADFFPRVALNGKTLPPDHGCGVSWIPAACLPAGMETETEAKGALEHYGLDPAKAWTIRRWTYHWATKHKPRAIRSLRLTMERDEEELSCPPFVSPGLGESVTVNHPLTGAAYTLTVVDYEAESVPQEYLPDTEAVEYPRHLVTMRYSLTPELERERFSLRDRSEGDTPRAKQPAPEGAAPEARGGTFVVFDGSGPTAIYITVKARENLRAACSGLYFAPVPEPIEWEPVFREKRMEDVEVKLISREQETLP